MRLRSTFAAFAIVALSVGALSAQAPAQPRKVSFLGLGAFLASVSQTQAPYTVTSANPLAITSEAPSGTVAFLEAIADSSTSSRTAGTRAGFDFTGVGDGGQAWTGLVYRTGDGPTMRAAIELPAGHLSAPEPYPLVDTPWSWSRIRVLDDPVSAGRHGAAFAGPRGPPGIQGLVGGPALSAGVAALVRAAPGSVPTPNQSYLLKEMQTTIAACLSVLVSDISGGAPYVKAPWKNPQETLNLRQPVPWRIANQTFRYWSAATVTFTGARWDPEKSHVRYGPERLAQNVEVNNPSKTRIIRNASDATVHVSYTETESLTDSFSSSVTDGLTIDVTAASTQEVHGEYAGVGASVSLTEEFGVSKTSEETREQGEEGTHEASITVEFDAAAGHFYLVSVTKEHEVTYQDFWIVGTMDFDTTITYGPRRGRLGAHYPPGGSATISGGLDGLRQYVYGFDTSYPEMAGYYDAAYSRTKNGLGCVFDARRRQITVSGTDQKSLEKNADYDVRSIGTQLPGALAHLPVEDADQVGGGGSGAAQISNPEASIPFTSYQQPGIPFGMVLVSRDGGPRWEPFEDAGEVGK